MVVVAAVMVVIGDVVVVAVVSGLVAAVTAGVGAAQPLALVRNPSQERGGPCHPRPRRVEGHADRHEAGHAALRVALGQEHVP